MQVRLVVNLRHHPRYPRRFCMAYPAPGAPESDREHLPLPAAVAPQIGSDHEQSLAGYCLAPDEGP